MLLQAGVNKIFEGTGLNYKPEAFSASECFRFFVIISWTIKVLFLLRDKDWPKVFQH